MKRITVLGLALFVALSISCSKKTENRSRAVITFIIGEVQAFRDNAWGGVETGSELYQGDRIRTKGGSTVDVQIGQSVVRVKEKSEVALATLFMDRSTGSENTALELAVGTVLAKPRKLVKGESFMIKTPTAVAGVRGTMFMVEASAAKDTRVEVVDGRVQVSKRIAALENIESESVRESEAIRQIEAHVEESSVTVTENRAVKVEAKEVAKVNTQVEKVVEAVVAVEEKKVEAPPVEVAKVVERIAAVKAIKADEVRDDASLKKEFEEMKIVEIKEPVKEAPAEKGSVNISVRPESALVYLNGEMVGSGDISLEMPAGSYSLKVAAEGYEDFQKDVVLAADRPLKEKIELARLRPLDRVRWNLDVRSPVKEMAYSGRRVFVATGEGMLLAFERDNAARAWQKKTGLVTSGLALGKDTLYFATADEMLNAVSMETGEIVWTEKLDGAVIDTMTAVVTPSAVYIATTKGMVYSFGMKGKRNWKFDAGAGVFETPIMVNNRLLVSGSDGKLYSLAAQSGKEQWTVDMGAKFRLAYQRGTLYAVSYYGAVSALGLEKGAELWKKELADTYITAPLVSDNRMMVAGMKGTLTWLNLDNGSVIAKKGLGGAVRNPMVLSDGILYVSANDTLFAIDASGGGVQWKHQAQGRISTSASIVGNEVYVGLDNGRVVSLNRNLERTRR
ncbi:MAG: PQQ-binding-like beta-propeller repeat protein [Spirochaetota bacterium]